MAYYSLIAPKQQWVDANGNPLSGYKLFQYTAGTSTKKTTYTDDTGGVANANPLILNSSGQAANGVYGTTGAYKLVLALPTDTDPPASPVWTQDGVAGINDTGSVTLDQWLAFSLTPTYISGTSFSVPGDQTGTLQIGRRVKTDNSGGTRFSTITNSVFGAGITTVTVVNDSGTLDVGLSAVYYGIISPNSTSTPTIIAQPTTILDGTADFVSFLDSSTGQMGKTLARSLSAQTLLFVGNTTSGTNIDLVASGLAGTGYAELIIYFDGVSLSGTDDLLVQVSNAGGFITSGYNAATSLQTAAISTALSSAGFIVSMGVAGRALHGHLTLRRRPANAIPGGDTWTCSYCLAHSGSTSMTTGGGSVSLGSFTPVYTLDGVRIRSTGANTFDAGTVAMYARF